MDYSEEFDAEIQELEDTAIHLANCETVGQVDVQQQNQFAAQLDHVVNTFEVDCGTVTRHVEAVKRIWKTRDHASTASKHIDTVHQALLAAVCEDHDPVY